MPDIDLAYSPHPHALEVHQGMLRRKFGIVAAHRRFGKTTLGAAALIDAALHHPTSDGRFAYVAPYLKQAKDIVWPMLRGMAQNIPGVTIYEGDLIIKFANGSRIRLYGADNYDALRGGYLDGVLVDEAADIREGVWFEVILPMLADHDGWALFIGTPKGMANLFYTIWEYAGDNPDQWYRGWYPANETNLPWLDDEKLAMYRKMQPESIYRQEFLCDFTASSDNILIPLDLVLAAEQRSLTEHDQEHLPRVIGIDIARYGDDASVIQKRWGRIAYEPVVIRKTDNMSVAARAAQEISDFDPHAVFIDAGRGEGVIDRLRQLGYPVQEINFGGSDVMDPLNKNRRTEMYWNMAQWFLEEVQIPKILELRQELTIVSYSFSTTGQRVLIDKDKIKSDLNRSTDHADALALTFVEPVYAPPPEEIIPGVHRMGHQTEWDPEI